MRGGMTSRQQLRSDIVEHMKHTHPNALRVQHRARASGSAPIREDPDMKGVPRVCMYMCTAWCYAAA